MATLNFVCGTIRGKIGQFVGSSWKGKNYIKTFAKPGNPRTADQVAVRTVFYRVSSVAKAVYEAVLKPYTFPRPRRMTAYNRMIQINKPMFDTKAWDPEGLKIFEGPLANPGIATAALAGDKVTVSFTAETENGTDKAIAVIVDDATGAAFCKEGTRAGASLEVSVAGLADKTNLHAYLVFVREPVVGTEEKGQVSGTAYEKVA